MSKAPLKGAGREVRSLVEQFSDALLAEEERCFARVDASFRQAVGDLPADVVSRLGRVSGQPARLRSERPLQNRLLRGQQSAATDAGQHVRALAERAEQMAYQSIARELRVCERTMSRRYRGLTTAAVEAAQEQGASLVDVSAEDYAAAATAAIGRFRTAMLLQFGLAEGDADLVPRLFSETKVTGVRGFGGRGVWWGTPADLKAVARRWAVEIANTTRTAVMVQFNEIGAERG